MADIVDIALKENGVAEHNNGHMKYINWYGGFGVNTRWCAIFVSWCANQAGISTSIIPKYALVSNGMAWFQKQGRFQKKGYQPKRGDIVFFKNDRSHTGIVERSDGSKFYTIEGNSDSQVRRRSYFLNEKTLTGFGIPSYNNMISISSSNSSSSSSSSSSNTTKQKRDVTKEIGYLNDLLKEDKSKKPGKPVEMKEVEGKLEGQSFQLLIEIEKKLIEFPVVDGVTLTYDRKGSPGKLTFKVIYSKEYKIQEGDAVLFIVDERKLFFGFVFTKDRDKEKIINVTAYDQLRYLKNKGFYQYTKKTTGQLIKIIAEDYHLKTGTLADTKHPITRIEDNVTLLDMIQNSLDETLMETGEIYVLYDTVGEITLKNVKSMKVNTCFISDHTAENFSYKSSIDSDVYNKISLRYEDKESKKVTPYVKSSIENINKWGILQYFDKVDSKEIGDLRAEALLKFYNQKKRSLSINGVFGNKKVKGGSLVPVVLNLGDIKVSNYMLVEKVTHKFQAGTYLMDLILTGGDFNG